MNFGAKKADELWTPAPKLGMTRDIAPQTELPACLAEAVRTLYAALDRLDAASERRVKAESQRATLEEELAVLQDDRLKLAAELDGADARVRVLEAANDEVKRRLAYAGAEIRAVLAGLTGQDG